MQVPIPHNLGREEARRRMQANSPRMGDGIPGGMAQVEPSWPSEDRMALSIQAMEPPPAPTLFTSTQGKPIMMPRCGGPIQVSREVGMRPRRTRLTS